MKKYLIAFSLLIGLAVNAQFPVYSDMRVYGSLQTDKNMIVIDSICDSTQCINMVDFFVKLDSSIWADTSGYSLKSDSSTYADTSGYSLNAGNAYPDLTENTEINASTYYFRLHGGTGGIQLTNNQGAGSILIADNSNAGLFLSRANTGEFHFDTDGMVINDYRGTPNGIEYDDDYSATYTSRSLIDKGYADATYSTAYGSMYGDNIDQAVTITSSDTYFSVPDNITLGESNAFTLQGDSALVCNTTGLYLVTYSISAQVAAGDEWEGGVLINGTVALNTTAHSESTQGATTRPQCNSGSGIINLLLNDLVTFGISNHAAAENAIVHHCNMTLLKL